MMKCSLCLHTYPYTFCLGFLGGKRETFVDESVCEGVVVGSGDGECCSLTHRFALSVRG